MTVNNARKVIEDLDLDPIKMKLMHVESGEGWSADKSSAVEIEYRRFLYLMKAYPDEPTAPTVDVDTFWHYHILDTMKYAADCATVYGYFLHHFPYLGMRGDDDKAAMIRSADRMRELYEETFGERYPGAQAAYCTESPIAAYCTQPAKTAYCTVTAKTAYCTQPTATAYCTSSAKAAYCTVTTQAAYCTTTAKPAADTAYCSVTGTPAYCTQAPAAKGNHSVAARCVLTA